MDCREIKRYIEDYVLGELDPGIEIQVNTHLTECENCQREIEERESLVNLFRESRRFEPSLETYSRVRSNIRLPQKRRGLVRGVPKSLIFVTASFLFGIVVMRAVDVFIFSLAERQKVEATYEPLQQEPFSDTVQFYTVPVKNLART